MKTWFRVRCQRRNRCVCLGTINYALVACLGPLMGLYKKSGFFGSRPQGLEIAKDKSINEGVSKAARNSIIMNESHRPTDDVQKSIVYYRGDKWFY